VTGGKCDGNCFCRRVSSGIPAADANVRPFAQARLGLGFEERGEKK
jgi:hypothetical protein